MKTIKKATLITAITIAMALTLSCNEKEAEFRSVKIGTQTWMVENLNDPSKGGKCYGNDESNCEKYGRLYTWNEAMKACPTGWRLPSNDEWQTLVNFAGGVEVADFAGGCGYKVAGTKLKAKNGWLEDGNGTDDYGFSALPGGSGNADGDFRNVGNFGSWWSASESISRIANSRYLDYGVEYFCESVGSQGVEKTDLNSVRCIKEAK